MGKSAYPTDTDVEDVLAAAGIAVGTLDTATAAAAGAADFEQRVGRRMLAPAGEITRYFAPPVNAAGCLELDRDLATCSAVAYQPEGASAETLVLNTDYWPLPLNARADTPARPWTAIRFARRWMLSPDGAQAAALHRAVRVTGRWGYDISIPEDAWLAMLYRAVALLSPQAGTELSSGYVRYAESGVEKLWGEAPYLELRRMGDRWFEEAVGRYRRVRV